jgi:hypothetical protein
MQFAEHIILQNKPNFDFRYSLQAQNEEGKNIISSLAGKEWSSIL